MGFGVWDFGHVFPKWAPKTQFYQGPLEKES
jgi:hypothetical protein